MSLNLELPNFILTTRRGTVYQLTPRNQQRFDIPLVMLSLGDFVHLAETTLKQLQTEGVSVKRFLGFTDAQLLCVSSVSQ